MSNLQSLLYEDPGIQKPAMRLTPCLMRQKENDSSLFMIVGEGGKRGQMGQFSLGLIMYVQMRYNRY